LDKKELKGITVTAREDFQRDSLAITVSYEGFPSDTYYVTHEILETSIADLDYFLQMASDHYVEKYKVSPDWRTYYMDGGKTAYDTVIPKSIGITNTSGWGQMLELLGEKYSILNKNSKCPVGKKPNCGGSPTVMNLIIHLNDEHKWTREQVADWVDTL
jgi:hypothetical protein